MLAPPRPEIALIGRSNVGKSSLLNALVGRHALARTSRTPGKTRALNVFDVDSRFYYVDLPGYGYAQLPQAQRYQLRRLVRDYLAAERAAGIVWLLDLRRDPSPDDLATGALLAQHRARVLVALTKADQVARTHRRERRNAILERLQHLVSPDHCLETSARTGEGIPELRRAVERLVARYRPARRPTG